MKPFNLLSAIWFAQTLLTILFTVLFYKTIKNSRQNFSGTSEKIVTLQNELEIAHGEAKRVTAIVESMVEGVVVINNNQKILLINSVLSRAFDLRREDAEGRSFWEVFRDPRINEMIAKSLKDRYALTLEHSILLSNSTFQIQVSPVFKESEFLGVTAVFHDVTKLKELEKIRSDFVANVSHELKTPLTSIIGSVETLKAGAADHAQDRSRFLDVIEEHSQNLNRLIEDLLSLSKIESTKEDAVKERTDIVKLVKKIRGVFQRNMESKKIRFDLRPDKSVFVSIEPLSMEQAISNLIDNAVKYSEFGGQISVEVLEDAGHVRFVVKDTGIGIPEADLPRIFERFYRVDKSRSRESGGTGLGLSIVKHIVEKHNGQIQVQSQLHKGSAFTITLPRS